MRSFLAALSLGLMVNMCSPPAYAQQGTCFLTTSNSLGVMTKYLKNRFNEVPIITANTNRGNRVFIFLGKETGTIVVTHKKLICAEYELVDVSVAPSVNIENLPGERH